MHDAFLEVGKNQEFILRKNKPNLYIGKSLLVRITKVNWSGAAHALPSQ